MQKRLLSLLLAIIICFSSAAGFATAYDKDGLKQEIYNHLIQMDKEFTIVYKGSTVGISEMVDAAIKEAIAHDDYLYFAFISSKVAYRYSSQDAEIRISAEYRTSPEQEVQVRAEVERILKMLKLEGLSDYYRIQKIVDYMSETYTYDKTLTKRTAYELITTKTAVCQGYGELFYLLAKGAGVPVRNQEGTLEGGAHLWNLVKIGSEWYHADVTNQHLYKDDPYVLMGSDRLTGLTYKWNKLVEYTANNTGSIQIQYNSNTYDPNKIAEKLTHKAMGYEPSEDAKREVAVQEAFAAKKKALEKYFANKPEIQTAAVYDQALDTLESMRVMDRDPELVYKFDEKFYKLEVANADKMANYANAVVKSANNAKGKTFTEKGYLSALKLLTDGRAKVSEQTFDLENRKYYTKVLDGHLKTTVNKLINYYAGQYSKTGKAVYKTKAMDLAMKYAAQLK